MPRTLLYTSTRVFILFNKDGDKRLGKGSSKKVELALDYPTGEWFSLASMKREVGVQECRNNDLVKDIAGFHTLTAKASYICVRTSLPKVRILRPYYDSTLYSFVRKNNLSLAPDQSAKIISQIFHAIIELHRRDIIFRDLKSSNVLINVSFNVVINDFESLAKLKDKVARDQFRTTCWWAPPEYVSAYLCDRDLQAQIDEAEGENSDFAVGVVSDLKARQKKLSLRVNSKPLDMWALGCLVYEILHGTVPQETLLQKCHKNRFDHHTKILPLMHRELKTLWKTDKGFEPEPANKKSIEHVMWRLLKFQPHERMTAEQLEAAMKEGIVFSAITRSIVAKNSDG